MQLRFVKLLLIAGEFDKAGLLPPVESIAYDMGLTKDGETKAIQTLAALQQVGVVDKTHEGWVIVNWNKRQASESVERVRRFRQRQKEAEEKRYSNGYSNVTQSSSSSVSSLDSESSHLKPGEDSLNSKDEEFFKGEDFKFYEQNIGILTPMIAEGIQDAQDEYPPGWIQDAIEIAVKANKRSWAYCEAILKRWKIEGKQSRLNGRKSGKKSAMEIVDEWGKELGYE